MMRKNGISPTLKLMRLPEVYELVRNHKVCPYYAIVCFDGDDMGKCTALGMKQEHLPLEFHKELSRKLQRLLK